LRAHPHYPQTLAEVKGMSELRPFSSLTPGSRFASCRDVLCKSGSPLFDRLPKPGTDKLGERKNRTVLMFPNVDVRALSRTYNLSVFTVPKHEKLDFDFVEQPERLKRYLATTAGAVHSPLAEDRDAIAPPQKRWFNIYCRIDAALEELHLTNTDYKLIVIARDSDGRNYNLDELMSSGVLPKPFIGGPLFLNDDVLTEGQCDQDVETLQKYLRSFGYLRAPVSGCIDEATTSAIIEFQGFSGITVDGIYGPELREKMSEVRFTAISDDKAAFSPFRQTTIRYYLGKWPCYLRSDRFVGEVERCFALWFRATRLRFARVSKPASADIKIGFRNHSLRCKKPYPFGSRGCLLCEIDEDRFINLDSSERWLLWDEENRKGCFKVYPVLLHAVGHVLGMKNSSLDVSVMNPFYSSTKVFLMEDDYRIASRLYSGEDSDGFQKDMCNLKLRGNTEPYRTSFHII